MDGSGGMWMTGQKANSWGALNCRVRARADGAGYGFEWRSRTDLGSWVEKEKDIVIYFCAIYL